MSLPDRHFLPGAHLLRKNREFQRVYQRGRRFPGDGFVIIILPTAREYNRLGISVQKKIGNAVRRNRIKRLIREVFRLDRSLFPPSSDIVFAVRPGFAAKGTGALQALVRRILSGQNLHGEASP